jgi:hypothetical protein
MPKKATAKKATAKKDALPSVDTNHLKPSVNNLFAQGSPIGMNPGTDVGGLNTLEFIRESQLFLASEREGVESDVRFRALETLIEIMRTNDCTLEGAANLSTDLADQHDGHDEDSCEDEPCKYCNLWTVVDQSFQDSIDLKTAALNEAGDLLQPISKVFLDNLHAEPNFTDDKHCINCNRVNKINCQAEFDTGSRYKFGDKVTVVRLRGTCKCGQVNSYYVGSYLE